MHFRFLQIGASGCGWKESMHKKKADDLVLPRVSVHFQAAHQDYVDYGGQPESLQALCKILFI